MIDFSYKNVEIAYNLISKKVIKTPLVSNDYINNLLKAEVFFKCENFQTTVSVSYTHLRSHDTSLHLV